MTNTTERSSILLLCLGLDSDKAAIKGLSVRELFDVFRPFGRLLKIIIFSKKILLKAFLQFSRNEEAHLALEQMHETFVNDFGKARLYFSALQELSFSNRYLEYQEYNDVPLSVGEPLASQDFSSDFDFSRFDSIRTTKDSIAERSEDHRFSAFRAESPAARDSYPLSELKPSQFANLPASASLTPGFISVLQTDSVRKIRQFAPFLNNSGSTSATKTSAPGKPSEEESRATGTTPMPSKVILISNLEGGLFTVKELVNVFSCFGNIAKALLMKNLSKALVEYTKVEFAQSASLFMNNKQVGGSRLKVNFSKYKKIDLKKNNKSENSQQFNEVMIVSPAMHRFSEDAVPQVQPPSDTLVASVLSTGETQPIDLFLLFQDVVKPQNIKILSDLKENSETGHLQIALKFSSLQDAVRALSRCHNQEIRGSPLSVAFSTLRL